MMRFDLMHPRVMPIPHAGCWIWTGAIGKDGYGVTWDGRKYWRAHRLAWRQHRGPIPDGLQVLHKCDVPSCINPDHLFVGTADDNNQDKVWKGRQTRGAENGAAKLTEELARKILSDPRPSREAAAAYGISKTHISAIRAGHKWAHLRGAG